MHRMRTVVWFAILVCIFGLTASVESAQKVALTGKVTNLQGKGIAGAIVVLPGKNISDTTDASGSYSITLSNAVKFIPTLPSTERISLENGIISIGLIKPATVGVELYDMKGNLLEKALDNPLSAGNYRFDIKSRPLAANMMIIRVSVGQNASTFRYLPLKNGRQPVTSSLAMPSADANLGKIEVTVDSLKASAPGYLAKSVAISSYQATVNIPLDTIGIGKFSFFVTSVKALRDLSKNINGFGGDLRFGKTGPGAGLLGADSICSCIAEKSMPGSKVKIWHAYLSVAKDANGKQVNAIDRVGEGPWYDRLGKLVAKTKADLLHDRPTNIDVAIKEDLPNENGIPNHQPDPNQPTVDNHLTITGSDSLGKLFSATSTCEDWTAKDTITKSKPRSGLSWTRPNGGFGGFGKQTAVGMGGFPIDTSGGFQMMTNMKSFVSVWNLPGCLAGIDSLESTMAGKPGDKSIGAGGGYGGFYCFGLNP